LSSSSAASDVYKRQGRSSTVQAATNSPASWASPTSAGVTSSTDGWRAVHPRSVASATLRAGSNHEATSNPVGSSAWASRTDSRVAGQNEEITTDVVRPDATTSSTTSAATLSSGSNPGSPGRFLISMLTIIASQTSRAGPSRGTNEGRSPAASSCTGPTPLTTGS